jgi:hypothetical protein
MKRKKKEWMISIKSNLDTIRLKAEFVNDMTP